MKKTIFFLFLFFVACENKISHEVFPNQDVFAQKIEKSTGFLVRNIESIREFSCDFGTYRIIEFTDVNSIHRNLVMSNFAIDVVSSQIKYIGQQDNTVEDRIPGWCYEYWCTSGGDCSSCQVTLSNPSNPVMKCSCSACHLNVRRYECDKE